jgi:hypothetical protein
VRSSASFAAAATELACTRVRPNATTISIAPSEHPRHQHPHRDSTPRQHTRNSTPRQQGTQGGTVCVRWAAVYSGEGLGGGCSLSGIGGGGLGGGEGGVGGGLVRVVVGDELGLELVLRGDQPCHLPYMG